MMLLSDCSSNFTNYSDSLYCLQFKDQTVLHIARLGSTCTLDFLNSCLHLVAACFDLRVTNFSMVYLFDRGQLK
jgi:hypothetical protein